MRAPPPKKKAGEKTGPRRLDGELLDVAGVTTLLLGEENGSEKKTREKTIRARVARRELPHRRWGGRVVFLRSEILAFLDQLPGVTVKAALENVATRNGHEEGPA